jgi:hypothetical protein
VAIMPHCVACGFDKGFQDIHEVAFANYAPGWIAPTTLGWSNELGVTAPPGVGLFCDAHLARARRLRHLPSVDAVTVMTSTSTRSHRCSRWLTSLVTRAKRLR